MAIDWTILENQITGKFDEIVEDFKDLQIEQLNNTKWNWPRLTRRRNGQLAGSPRDIVDTGKLRDSLEIEPVTSTEVIYSYPVNYAIIVHEGTTLHTGTEIPPRPWVDESAKELKINLNT